VSSPERPLHRSFLFAPGIDAGVMRKALGAGADAVILDLEDSVSADRKAEARTVIASLLDDPDVATLLSGEDAPEVHLRVNQHGSSYSHDDLRLAASPWIRAVRLPKAESVQMVVDASEFLADLERGAGVPVGTIGLYPTIESALGVLECRAIAGSVPRVVSLVLGQADLVADIGASGDDALATLVPRSMLVLASRAEGINPPVDGAFTDLGDEAGLRTVLARARSLGMFGKSAIHPRQLAPIHETFGATPDELRWAEEVVAAAESAERAGDGVTVLRGEMIDRAVVQRARGVLALRRIR
jgi:citrate lyase subunit beta/citryl-CoA lyase